MRMHARLCRLSHACQLACAHPLPGLTGPAIVMSMRWTCFMLRMQMRTAGWPQTPRT